MTRDQAKALIKFFDRAAEIEQILTHLQAKTSWRLDSGLERAGCIGVPSELLIRGLTLLLKEVHKDIENLGGTL